MADRPKSMGSVIVASTLPMFMVSLNNLVVINALPAINWQLGASVVGLQWVINVYVLSFAGLLLTGAALGDRYGRRRVFIASTLVFIAGSIGCALSRSIMDLVYFRVLQGVGAAAVFPLSLTLVAGTVPEHRRGAAVGLWGGLNGLGVALGPMIGGAITQAFGWPWIFWLNVPFGLLGIRLVMRAIDDDVAGRKGDKPRTIDLPGVVLASAAVTLAVWGIVQASVLGWIASQVLGAFAISTVLAMLFVFWERRARNPLLPLRFYRIRTFVLSNLVSLAMFFGVFGSIFFLVQYMQGPMGFSPFAAGVRTLPWTAMPMVVAPVAGLIADRVGGARLIAIGMFLTAVALAWIAVIARIDLTYGRMVPALVLAGIGMGLMLAPTAVLVLNSVTVAEHGKASGANTTIREVGGALGVAVLTTVFRSSVS
jgi:EmrB/QacA subfamily drug resistance transporter